MADPELVKILRQGVDAWNRWRQQQPAGQFIDLSEASLSGINLRSADLVGMNLSNAGLSGADLGGASLIEANLSEANLTEANLAGANLSAANLTRADLSRAKLRFTTFSHVDLRTVKGLATLNHRGPSSIDLQSVQLPQDSSALYFLRDCGVPDEWIDFYRVQKMHPIQYHSCFICYSNKDEALARNLYADLQASGVRCWFAPEDMKIGDKIRSRIDEAIFLQDKLLVLLSEHSVSSDWVEIEVEAALERERTEHREILFPIRLDESVMRTSRIWAAMLRTTRHIGDFTHWTNQQAYQLAFSRLMRDLIAEVPDGQESEQ